MGVIRIRLILSSRNHSCRPIRRIKNVFEEKEPEKFSNKDTHSYDKTPI